MQHCEPVQYPISVIGNAECSDAFKASKHWWLKPGAGIHIEPKLLDPGRANQFGDKEPHTNASPKTHEDPNGERPHYSQPLLIPATFAITLPSSANLPASPRWNR